MLHISDVETRLKNCPEPTEVREMRHKVIESFSDLEFFEEPHEYIRHKPDGDIKLPSVTGVVQRFEPHVDWDAACINKATKLGIDPAVLKRQWTENNITSTSNGSKTHLFGESCLYFMRNRLDLIDQEVAHYQLEKGYLIPYGKKEIAASKLYEDILTNHNVFPVMAEAKVYTGKNDTLKLKDDYCGTFDILWAYRDKQGVIQPLLMDWKGLPLDTPIMTTKGFKTMGELTKDDIVFDKNGKPCHILNISEVHHNPCYKIKFDDGYEIIADCDHRWEIHFGTSWGKDYHSKIMTTQELKDYLKTLKRSDSRKIPKIMVNKPIELPEKELPIDPYVLGVWLGDGSKACGIITNMYDELFEEIKKRGFTVGNDVSKDSSGKAKECTVYGLRTLLNKNNLLMDKHIPLDYLLSSYNQRLELLQGLMDTDGYYNKVRKRYIFSQKKEELMEDFLILLRSLGIKPNVFKVKKHYKDKEGNKHESYAYDICFWSDVYPFKIRKIDVQKPQNNKHSFRNIRSIEEVETVPTKCIEVDSPTHTYLADKELLVTHNTNKSLYKDYNRQNGIMMLPPFDDFVDEPLSHYIVQLSMYSMAMEQIGIVPKNRIIIWLKDDGTYEKIPVPYVGDRLRKVL